VWPARRLVQQTYTNDTYSIDNPRQSFLLLRNTPVFSLTSLQWRAGTPTNPNWTDFIADQFELVDPRTDPISGTTWYPSGEVRVYGVLPRIYNNMIRATYVGGYPVNWANPEDHNTHWLPGDLTNVCENLVVRRFKRRQLAGMSSERIGDASTSYRNTLDQEDLDVLGQYRQLNFLIWNANTYGKKLTTRTSTKRVRRSGISTTAIIRTPVAERRWYSGARTATARRARTTASNRTARSTPACFAGRMTITNSAYSMDGRLICGNERANISPRSSNNNMEFQVQITGLGRLTAKLAEAPSIAAPILQRALVASQAILARNTNTSTVPVRSGFLVNNWRGKCLLCKVGGGRSQRMPRLLSSARSHMSFYRKTRRRFTGKVPTIQSSK